MYVRERMTKDVVSVSFNAKASDALLKMNESRHSKLPVTDEKGRVMGIISIERIAGILNIAPDQISGYVSDSLLKSMKITDIMQHGVLRINKDKLIEEAALFMKENRLKYLPVIDDKEILSGVLTYSDIISAFVTVSGIRENGTRIVIDGSECMDRMGDAIECINQCEDTILFASAHVCKDGSSVIVIKTSGKHTENVIFKLESKGFKILKAKNE